jgi:hypothetical protein
VGAAAPWRQPLQQSSAQLAVAAACSTLRCNRARLLLAQAERALLQSCGASAAPAPAAASALLPSLPLLGLEVQSSFCELLLSGRKVIETRDYPLPQALQGVPLALLRSPEPGGSAVHGLLSSCSYAGSVVFSSCSAYRSRQQWEADAHKTCVPVGAAAACFGWPEQEGQQGLQGQGLQGLQQEPGEEEVEEEEWGSPHSALKYAWHVSSVQAAPAFPGAPAVLGTVQLQPGP